MLQATPDRWRIRPSPLGSGRPPAVATKESSSASAARDYGKLAKRLPLSPADNKQQVRPPWPFPPPMAPTSQEVARRVMERECRAARIQRFDSADYFLQKAKQKREHEDKTRAAKQKVTHGDVMDCDSCQERGAGQSGG